MSYQSSASGLFHIYCFLINILLSFFSLWTSIILFLISVAPTCISASKYDLTPKEPQERARDRCESRAGGTWCFQPWHLWVIRHRANEQEPAQPNLHKQFWIPQERIWSLQIGTWLLVRSILWWFINTRTAGDASRWIPKSQSHKALLELLLFKVRVRKRMVTSPVYVSNAFEVHRISFRGNYLRGRVVITKSKRRQTWANMD